MISYINIHIFTKPFAVYLGSIHKFPIWALFVYFIQSVFFFNVRYFHEKIEIIEHSCELGNGRTVLFLNTW